MADVVDSAGHHDGAASADACDQPRSASPVAHSAAAAPSRRIQPIRTAQLQATAQISATSTRSTRQTRSSGGGGLAGAARKQQQKYELPRWASATRQDTLDDDTDRAAAEIADEDFYLRCEAYRLASDTVDRALVQAWADSIDGAKTDGGESVGRVGSSDVSCDDKVEGGALVRDLEVFFGRYCPQLDHDGVVSASDVAHSTAKRFGPNDMVTPGKKRRLGESSSTGTSRNSTAASVTISKDTAASLDAIAEQASLFLQPHTRDPTILPLALLSVGPSVLDRAELVKLVHRGLARSKATADAAAPARTRSSSRNSGTNTKPAVCVLRGGPYRSFVTGKTFHGDLIRDILSQCIAQEAHRSQYLHLLEVNRKSRFKHVSYTERLVEWASLTEEFNSIVVILEDQEALFHRTFDAFMATMTSLRACYGVPICLVIASIDQIRGRTTLSRSSLDGIAGIDVRSFVSPPSAVILDNLISKLFISADERISLPLVLEASALNGIKASFADNNRSVVEAAMQIKLALAHHFGQKGSFLSMAQSSAFTTSQWQRIAWFCVDKDARSYIASTSKSDITSGSCTSSLRNMIWRKRTFALLNAWMKISRELLPSLGGNDSSLLVDFDLVEGRLSHSAYFDDLFHALCDFLLKLPLKDVKGLLIDWRNEMKRHAASFVAADKAFSLGYEYIDDEGLRKTQGAAWRYLQEDINNFIILFDAQETANARENDDDNNQAGLIRELRASLVHSLEMSYRRLKDFKMPFSSEAVRRETKKYASSGVKSLFPQVRRATARALALPSGLPDRTISTTHDPVIVFQSMTTRVIDIEEWYDLFVEDVAGNSTGNAKCRGDVLWQRFVFAVQELEICGLVSRSRRRGGNAFEKNAMVWSSGLH